MMAESAQLVDMTSEELVQWLSLRQGLGNINLQPLIGMSVASCACACVDGGWGGGEVFPKCLVKVPYQFRATLSMDKIIRSVTNLKNKQCM